MIVSESPSQKVSWNGPLTTFWTRSILGQGQNNDLYRNIFAHNLRWNIWKFGTRPKVKGSNFRCKKNKMLTGSKFVKEVQFFRQQFIGQLCLKIFSLKKLHTLWHISITKFPHWKKENPRNKPNDPPIATKIAEKSKIKYSSWTVTKLVL